MERRTRESMFVMEQLHKERKQGLVISSSWPVIT